MYPDPSHKQGHTKTQNKRLEEDSPIGGKNKTKTTGVVTVVSDKIHYSNNKD